MFKQYLAQMRGDIEELKTAFGSALRVAPVAVVDPVKGFRVSWGEDPDGGAFLSPWYPHPESGGATSTWAPLSVGQVVGVINPDGDPRQGILLRGGFSGKNPAPSQNLDENLYRFGGVSISVLASGAVLLEAKGAVTITAPQVNLGGEGGSPVARVGDLVEVGSGSSAGRWPIVTGSGVVSAVD